MLAAGKILACSLTLGIGGSGGVFAPSLFVGATSGMAFGLTVNHVLGSGAGQPALYAAVAMGAVFASAARAPLTSVASVVEMTGDYALTLPVMLAVAIATATSRALSYGTIYTTKLLRRGQDLDRAAPWRAFSDLKAADAMRRFPVPLPIPAARDGSAGDGSPGISEGGWTALGLPDTLVYQADPQAVYASESLAQTLHQLEAYGRDGLPVLSGDGRQLEGWITNASVLRAVGGEIGRARPDGSRTPGAAAGGEPAPPTPLTGYQVIELAVTDSSPAAGAKLGQVGWPAGAIPVSVLRDRSLRDPDPGLTLATGDRVSLLIPLTPAAENGTSGRTVPVSTPEEG